MKLVVDSNEVFAAVITKGRGLQSKILDILFSEGLEFIAPFRLYAELEKNRDEIRSKSGFSYKDFEVFVSSIKLRIKFVPLEDFMDRLEDAKSISPHMKDLQFFALALKEDCAIWSEEVSFKRQPKVKAFSTEDLIELLGL